MRLSRSAVAPAWLLVVAVLGCAPDAADESIIRRAAAPITGSVVLEPPTLRLGDVAVLEVVVETPPDHVVLPIQPPPEPEGVWLLDAERLPVERQGQRWIHRTRLRVRARELGGFSWPPLEVSIEGSHGEGRALTLDARRFEVVSVAPTLPDRVVPFGFRRPAPQPIGSASFARGLVTGVAGSLVLAGLVAGWLWRRRRRPATAPVEDDAARWRAARAAIDGASHTLDGDPSAAADRVAHALRRYAAGRSRLAGGALTTEELAAVHPRANLRGAWPELLDILATLDGARFPRRTDVSNARAELEGAFERAGAWIERHVPPGARS